MVKAKRVVIDAKTKEIKEEEFDYTPVQEQKIGVSVDINDLAKLIQYAKKQKWL